MSWKCPHCGFKTELAPLTFKVRERPATCPICGKGLPAVTIEESLDKSLRWVERENPTLFDHLMERMDRKAARLRTIRRIGVLAALVLLGLLAFLLFRGLV